MKGIIYCAKNNINNKIYIGQTTKTIDRRKKAHSYCKGSYHFQNALKKYDDWSWDVICDIEAMNKLQVKEYLDIAEKMYIKKYDSYRKGYNSTLGGDGCVGIIHTEKAKARIGSANRGHVHTEEHKQKISNTLKGVGLSGEHKRNISKARKGMKFTEETRDKMSKAKKLWWAKRKGELL